MTTYATDVYSGTGSQVEFAVTFDFIQRDHVKVFRIDKADGLEVELTQTDTNPTGDEYQWQSNILIEVGTAPTTEQTLKIQRDTPEDQQIIQWNDGSYIVADDLNTSDLQWLYGLQELEDKFGLLATTAIKYLGAVDLTVDEASANPTGGDFYINTGTGSVLASWTGIGGDAVVGSEQVVYNGVSSEWQIFAVPSSQQGVLQVLGTSPIEVDSTDTQRPGISITPATTAAAGSMSAADKTKLDGIPADYDGKYVEVIGDNMTGDLTLGTDKIQLNATNGDASFAGTINELTVSHGPGNDGSNTAVGGGAAASLTTGRKVTGIGSSALVLSESGDDNTAVGNNALAVNVSGDDNTAVGSSALLFSTGDNNTAVGAEAGLQLTTGSNNIIVGSQAEASDEAVSNEVTIGDANISKFRVPGIDFVLKDNGGTPSSGQVLTADSNGEGHWANPSGGGGVTQIVAGDNVTISPTDGTGVVTVNSTGGGGGGGVSSIIAGAGISVDQATGDVTITNTGGGSGGTTKIYGTAKAWGNIGADGTEAGIFNAEVNKTGLGSYTVTFKTPLPTANYAVVLGSGQSNIAALSSVNKTPEGFTVVIYANLATGELIDGNFNFAVHDEEPVIVSGGGGGGATIGAIVAWANSAVPSGWLECDGSTIPSQYSDLIALIGANTPDLRGEFVRGWDNGAGVDAGRTLLSSQADEFKEHNHTYAASSGTSAQAGTGTANLSSNYSTSTSSVGGTETRPRNVALMYIINADGSSIGGNSGVTSIATGVGLTGGPIVSTGTIDLADTAVVAGSYTATDLTVDAQGRITAASSGSASTPGDGTITLQSYGSNTPASSTFSTNQSGNATIILPRIAYSDLSGVPSSSGYVTNVAPNYSNNFSFGSQTGSKLGNNCLYNFSMHYRSLKNVDDGDNNVAIGTYAMYSPKTSSDCVAIGERALEGTSGTGSDNIAIGLESLQECASDNNIAIGGNSATNLTTGAGNIVIGPSAGTSLSTGDNNVIVSSYLPGVTQPIFTVRTEDNRLVMGHSQITNAYVKVTWTVTSDERDKMNFAPVPYGLDFVNQLKPTAYQFKAKRDTDTAVGSVRYGFKAQDILALEGENPVIIDAEDVDHLKYKGEHLVPVLVNAVQELTTMVNELKAEVIALKGA